MAKVPAAPGWYPDPKGGYGQRYFDGAKWTDQTAPAAAVAAAPARNRPGCFKTVLGVIAVLFFIGWIGSQCSHDDKGSSSANSSPSSSSASAPSRTPTGPAKPDATFTTSPGTDGDEVMASFGIKDNLTEGLIKDGARFATIDILKYAKATYANASQVTVRGSFPMKDAYGNTSTDVVVNVTYLRSTLEKINFNGIDKDQIWEIRDSGFIAPAFRP